MSIDLETPKNREAILESISPVEAKDNHDLLRDIFLLEMEYRRSEEDFEYFENLYHCGLLLYFVGDPSDVSLMWDAKNINMDTGCGFDIETLFGAGFEETMNYLEKTGLSDLKSELSNLGEVASKNALEEWAEFKRNYYYA